MRTIRPRFMAAMLWLVVSSGAAMASSHREAPLIKEDPAADNTDVYVFVSPETPANVVFVANYSPLSEPAGGPNFISFSDSALYEIHVDNDGDAVEDITYQFRFQTEVADPGATFLYNTGPVTTLDDADLNVRQFYSVRKVLGDRRTGTGTMTGESLQVAPPRIGPKSTPDYAALAAAAAHPLGEGRVFAGPRDDSFFVDLGSVFDLATLRPLQHLHAIPPAAEAVAGVDNLRGYNVLSIVLEVPISSVTNDAQVPSGPDAANAVIGVWATTSRPRVSIRSGGREQSFSGFQQVSRLGIPLINEVVIPLALKDAFNALEPSQDLGLFQTNEAFADRILDPEISKLENLLYGVPVPPPPRNDILETALLGVEGLNRPPNVVPAEMIRINLAISPAASPSRMGVLAGDLAGFPNGRRLGDDVVDILLQVFAGVLVDGFNMAPNNVLTDGVDVNDVPYLATFPYLALPHEGFSTPPHGAGAE